MLLQTTDIVPDTDDVHVSTEVVFNFAQRILNPRTSNNWVNPTGPLSIFFEERIAQSFGLHRYCWDDHEVPCLEIRIKQTIVYHVSIQYPMNR